MTKHGWTVNRWVAAYTRGLPPDVRDRRREEIASDLYEHAVADRGPGHSTRVLRRLLTGVPADLAWRRSVQADAAFEAGRFSRRGVKVAVSITTVTAAIQVVIAVAAGVGWGADPGTEPGGVRYALPLLVGALLLAHAVAAQMAKGQVALASCLVGVFVPSVVLPWMAPVFVPAGLVVGTSLIGISRMR